MDEKTGEIKSLVRRRTFFDKDRNWLNLLLFVLTALSTFFVGLGWSLSYLYADHPEAASLLRSEEGLLWRPEVISLSLIYAAVLMAILLGHELGHYLVCRRYRISATLPFFLPAPTLVGTLGAFIKIRSPITRKQQLFDVGVAGPLISFFLALPALVVGLSLSKAVPALPREEAILFGEPLLLKIIGGFLFPGLSPDSDIILHPVAFAGWVGILVTSLNLLPIGQLDGGHILYSWIGERAKKTAVFLIGLFLVMGIVFWIGWFIWAVLVYFLGLKHPRIWDEETPLSPFRKALSVLVVLIFALSFIPDPVKGYNLFDLMKNFRF
jgi:Zn-dependent protease